MLRGRKFILAALAPLLLLSYVREGKEFMGKGGSCWEGGFLCRIVSIHLSHILVRVIEACLSHLKPREENQSESVKYFLWNLEDSRSGI